MKKFVATFLAFTLLVFSTKLQELAKLPVLFQHYFEHKSITQEITFSTYLWDHYNDIPHTDADEARDNQLPFKSADKSGLALLSLAVPPPSPLTLHLIPISDIGSIPIPQDSDIPKAMAGKIWQPPKRFIYS